MVAATKASVLPRISTAFVYHRDACAVRKQAEMSSTPTDVAEIHLTLFTYLICRFGVGTSPLRVVPLMAANRKLARVLTEVAVKRANLLPTTAKQVPLRCHDELQKYIPIVTSTKKRRVLVSCAGKEISCGISARQQHKLKRSKEKRRDVYMEQAALANSNLFKTA